MGLLLFDPHGQVTLLERLDASGPLRGIELAENQVHSMVALEGWNPQLLRLTILSD